MKGTEADFGSHQSLREPDYRAAPEVGHHPGLDRRVSRWWLNNGLGDYLVVSRYRLHREAHQWQWFCVAAFRASRVEDDIPDLESHSWCTCQILHCYGSRTSKLANVHLMHRFKGKESW